jgi:uncharacterized protein (TIGR02145 family)
LYDRNYIYHAWRLDTMKTLSINKGVFAICAIIILFSNCRKTKHPEPGEEVPVQLFEMKTLLESTHNKFYENGALTNGNYKEALMLTSEWVKTRPEVEYAEPLDSLSIFIRMKSGLNSWYCITEVDAMGKPLMRGSGSARQVMLEDFTSTPPPPASMKLTNKKILFYVPAYTEFDYGKEKVIDNIAAKILGSDDKFEITVLKDSECRSNLISTFGDYGIVVIDAHGVVDGFLTGETLALDSTINTAEKMSKLLRNQGGIELENAIIKGHLGFTYSDYVAVGLFNWYQNKAHTKQQLYATSAYINSMPTWPGTIILGNFCYSGFGKPHPSYKHAFPIRTAFVNRNLISYYGYCFNNDWAHTASDKLSKMMEDSLLTALTIDGDSTGDAHRDYAGGLFLERWSNGSTPQYLRQFNSVNYAYDVCAVPLKDARDGEVYKTICIGDRKLMAENLRFKAPGSRSYNDDPANDKLYGRYYTWDQVMNGAASNNDNPGTVQGLCPEGWHLPSQAEWSAFMMSLYVGSTPPGKLLKSTTGWDNAGNGVDRYGFNARAAGHWDNTLNFYAGMGDFTLFWSSFEYSVNPVRSYAFQLTSSGSATAVNPAPKTSGVSCRCIKD